MRQNQVRDNDEERTRLEQRKYVSSHSYEGGRDGGVKKSSVLERSPRAVGEGEDRTGE